MWPLLRPLALILFISACAPPPATDAQATLAGQWHVLSLDGENVSPAGYRIHFDPAEQQFGGRFGCNHIGGHYRLNGTRLQFGEIASTLMMCHHPHHDHWADQTLPVITHADVEAVKDNVGHRLLLRDAQGRIRLEARPALQP